MGNTIIIALAAVLMPALLFFEKKESISGKLLTKTPLSLLFILAAVLQNHSAPDYYHFLLVGLILCLGGDVLLIFSQKKAFLIGLVSFLLGHVCYVFGFFQLSQISTLVWFIAAVASAFSIFVFIWLKPHLGSMVMPVLCYMIVITVMVIAAGSVLLDIDLPRNARFTIFAGALLFYFSDLFVARNRFLEKTFINRLFGLPLYYTGQFLLAFSIGLMN